ncbi:PREDICTED: olfactory receptor 6X1-like [Gekko japonicus]|uniref:Olfactory receptor n=1 Tax=Gekko japonicus TaxID=146911 RepID=A0ABM1KJ71_GEKJA|nr:PREDICTED: olfactory receptor 6X1-like [Gekko japonicus]
MALSNCSRVEEFVLLGFPHIGGINIVLFVFILVFYIFTITGNGLIIVIVRADHQLQKPMYFFLSNLSCLGMGHTTAIVPKMLVNLLLDKSTICFYCCMVQMFNFFFFGVTEFFILTVISFDRYLAICQPLRYTTIMNSSLCLQLAVASWTGGFFSIISQVIMVATLPFCDSDTINHFYCDVGPLLKIAGGETQLIEVLNFLVAVAVILTSLLLTVISYIFIISTILRIPSTSGQKKAFSTCTSHLTVVSIYYGAVLFIYLRPSIAHSSFSLNKAVSLLNTVVIPMLNPFIYTIRNMEVKEALQKVLRRKGQREL